MALVNGKRELFGGIALNTNFCMSNETARRIVTKTVCDYAQLNHNVDYLHVWLADWQKNHCECDNCRTKTPSDWYVVLLNDIDAELTRRGLSTRIAAVLYSETAYEPTCEHLKNPQRFLLLMGAITRSYTYSPEENPKVEHLTPFVLNRSGRLDSMEEHLVRAKLWQTFAPAPLIAYEYHFWKHQYYAPGTLCFAKRLYEDVRSYRANGFRGIIQDGSQRSFFPNGLNYYVYSTALFDSSVDFDGLVQDYCRHAYGQAAEIALDYLKAIDTHLPQTYLEAQHSIHRDTGKYYRPEMEECLLATEQICQEFANKLAAFKNMPYRVQTVAVRLLIDHTAYCQGIAKALALKCVGKDEEAKEVFTVFAREFGMHEQAIERYYDHTIAVQALNEIFNAKGRLQQ